MSSYLIKGRHVIRGAPDGDNERLIADGAILGEVEIDFVTRAIAIDRMHASSRARPLRLPAHRLARFHLRPARNVRCL